MRKSFLALLCMYGLLFAGLFHWHLIADLQNHPANPRYYYMFSRDRGRIYDRNGLILATSTPLEGGVYQRSYATPSLSHVLGYFHQRYGMTGLERLYHEDLSMGRTLLTSLDWNLQQTAEELLQGLNGAVLAIRPSTGEVLALVSSPSLDGNALDANWSDYLDDLRSPFLNRATHGLYPPGSIVKPIIYGAALEKGNVDRFSLWLDEGSLALQNRTIRNSGGKAHGNIDLDQALALSSNVVFAQLALSLGEGLLQDLKAFGLGQEVDFELSNLKGTVPAKIASAYDGAQIGIGQGELLVTPLQMAVVAQTIANDGVMMRPFLVTEVRGGLKMRQITRPRAIGEILPPAVAHALQEAMALAARQGTAQTDLSSSLDYGGKTGTAEMSQGQDHAWFLGFAPSTNPQVAVAVLVERGGSGSAVAAPIGAKLLAAALRMDE
ncbi:MAG: penicillin-binding transpeptidase domain-containing protein [Bacillota bacterium]|nr:penicillin-binding transpeptidase domain-containing protein [Bacillota bacterium]HHT91084.1 hypothetical protein [Bacillota bacterium]